MNSIQITDSRVIEILANSVPDTEIRRILEKLSEQNGTFQNSDISALMMKLSPTQSINFRTLFIHVMQYWIERAGTGASLERLHDILNDQMNLQQLANSISQIKSSNSKWWLEAAGILGGCPDFTGNHDTWKEFAMNLGLESDIPHLNTVSEINFHSFWIAALTKFRARTSNSLDRVSALLLALQSVGLMNTHNSIYQLVNHEYEHEACMETDHPDGYTQLN